MKTDATEALRLANCEADELRAAQRLVDEGPPHPDAAPTPKPPSSEIPEGHIQQNALLVPAVERRKLYDLAELLVEVAWYQEDELQVFERKARALVDTILDVGIQHYRRLASATIPTEDDTSIARYAERKAAIQRRLDAVKERHDAAGWASADLEAAASSETPQGPTWEDIGRRQFLAGLPRVRQLLDNQAADAWLRGWDEAEAASKK